MDDDDTMLEAQPAGVTGQFVWLDELFETFDDSLYQDATADSELAFESSPGEDGHDVEDSAVAEGDRPVGAGSPVADGNKVANGEVGDDAVAAGDRPVGAGSPVADGNKVANGEVGDSAVAEGDRPGPRGSEAVTRIAEDVRRRWARRRAAASSR